MAQMIKADVVIVGGGPAGMAAAIAAHEAGVKNILILERECALGGRYDTLPLDNARQSASSQASLNPNQYISAQLYVELEGGITVDINAQ